MGMSDLLQTRHGWFTIGFSTLVTELYLECAGYVGNKLLDLLESISSSSIYMYGLDRIFDRLSTYFLFVVTTHMNK